MFPLSDHSAHDTDDTFFPHAWHVSQPASRRALCQLYGFLRLPFARTVANSHAITDHIFLQVTRFNSHPQHGFNFHLIRLEYVLWVCLYFCTNHLLNWILSFILSLSIWPYPRAIYFNLCTLDHDNSSCVYRNRVTRVHTPRPVMSCRSSWFTYDTDLGSVIGYRKKPDVKSGLFVDLLNGDNCYRRGKLIYIRNFKEKKRLLKKP